MGKLRAEVVYIFAYDIAYEMRPVQLNSLLGRPTEMFSAGVTKRSPRQLFFYRPQTVRLPAQERTGPGGRVNVNRTVKLFPVGAISIQVRLSADADDLHQLVDYHDVVLDGRPLAAEARELAEQVRAELEPYCVRPVDPLLEAEAYTVFCLQPPLPAPGGEAVPAIKWLEDNRRQVAALLTQEAEAEMLSRRKAEEATGLFHSYYDNDLVVVDWDAALIVDEAANFEEILHIMELANVQLAELGAYDRILDDALQRSYRDLSRQRLRRGHGVLHGLREIRVDLARLSDELQNITKFFGDWHLARVYQSLAERFHLGDWHDTIDEKLRTLDELYRLLQQDRVNGWMIVLEATIVLLFIIDVAILLAGLAR